MTPSSRSPQILLAYPAVHEIFQLSLAASEMGELEALVCSAVDLPGKLGRSLSRLASMPSARPLGYDQLPPERIREFPWPVLVNRFASRLLRRRTEHLYSNGWFDRHVARLIQYSKARVFVGAETSAEHSLRAAKKRGMKCVLDCPGVPAAFLDQAASRAAAELGLCFMHSSNSMAMKARKARELAQADVILTPSSLAKDAHVQAGVAEERIQIIPLWVDAAYWRSGAENAAPNPPNHSLRVLYVGGISLRKGVPYLLKAAKELGDRVSLTLVGSVQPEMRELVNSSPARHHSPVPKEELRRIYHEHDVLVMPSLGDSFGFVAMEAMTAGLPVIVSASAGAPLPHESWRIPAADAPAIAERLAYYLQHPEMLRQDGEVAMKFAANFTPERYRAGVKEVFRELLGSSS